MGSDNIKGENLAAGHTKNEDIKFGAPDREAKFQFYCRIDTKNTVKESDENNNKSGVVSCRVHKRPDIKAEEIILNDGQVQFEEGEITFARATFTNSGGEPFEDVPVSWYVDGEFYADDNIRHWNIEKGDEKHEDVYLTSLSVGFHTLRVCADFDEDKNGSDNCMEINFEIVDPEPVCSLFQITKISDYGETADYQWNFSGEILYSKIVLTYKLASGIGWVDYKTANKIAEIKNWSKIQPIEFSLSGIDELGKWHEISPKVCPAFLIGTINHYHFIYQPE